MGTLDPRGKKPEMPKDVDDKKLATLFKTFDKNLQAFQGSTKAVKDTAGEVFGALSEIGVLIDEKMRDKKTDAKAKEALKKAYDAAYAYAEQFQKML